MVVFLQVDERGIIGLSIGTLHHFENSFNGSILIIFFAPLFQIFKELELTVYSYVSYKIIL